MKLGKLPATPDERDLRFARYLPAKLKTAPKGYGHKNLVTQPWGILGNDMYGDCAEAGPAHATMLWNAAAGRTISFTEAGVLAAYSAITGFDPSDPSTDQGSNMRDVLKYRQKVGLRDSVGRTHRIGAYVSISPKSFPELLQALWLFEAVEIGFEFPASAMSQFDAGRGWTVVHGSPIEGGHDVPVIGRPTAEGLEVVTWGHVQRMSRGFYELYNDEAWAVVSEEMLTGGRSLENFDLAALNADLARLQ